MLKLELELFEMLEMELELFWDVGNGVGYVGDVGGSWRCWSS
jgi:hypothetical protein